MTADIHDRANWPSPVSNPLIILFERDADWFSNTEIVAALGWRKGRSRSIVGQWPTLLEQLDPNDTIVTSRYSSVSDGQKAPQAGGQERYFTKKALALIAMRAQTVNAAAWRDWLASDLELEARLDRLG